MLDILRDLEAQGYAVDYVEIGPVVRILTVRYPDTVPDQSASFHKIRRIVGDRAEAGRASVGNFHAIIISE